jgi:hypothetical protein
LTCGVTPKSERFFADLGPYPAEPR